MIERGRNEEVGIPTMGRVEAGDYGNGGGGRDLGLVSRPG